MWFLWLVVAVVFAVFACSYLLPWIIARVLSLYLGATVRIGGILGGRVISQFYLNTQAFELSVVSLRFTSSVFSS